MKKRILNIQYKYLSQYFIILCLFSFCVSISETSFGNDENSIKIQGKVSFNQSDESRTKLKFIGELKWQVPKGEKEFCFLLPDKKKLEFGPSRLINKYLKNTINNQRISHRPKFSKETFARKSSKGIIKLIPRNGFVKMKFQWEKELVSPYESIVTDWFPRFLDTCDLNAKKASSPLYEAFLKTNKSAQISGQVTSVTPSEGSDQVWHLNSSGSKIPFVISQRHRFQTKTISGKKFNIGYFQPEYVEFLSILETLLPLMEEWLGEFPFENFTLLQMTEQPPHEIPGLGIITLPRQGAMKSIQADILNWRYWIMSWTLASQWLHASLNIEQKDDWLANGLVDFLTLEVLKKAGGEFNLFPQNEDSLLSFNYRQFQEIHATLLHQKKPFMMLTNKEFESVPKFHHSFSFVKHSIAMSYMQSILGAQQLKLAIRKCTSLPIGHSFHPRLFFNCFTNIKPNSNLWTSDHITHYLQSWWAKEGWSDYAIEYVDTHLDSDNKWTNDISLIQGGTLNLPVRVSVLGAKEKEIESKWFFPSRWKRNNFHGTITTSFPPQKVTIDHERNSYDENRFDNNDKSLANINFFPGNARSLSDDQYTLFWLPYALRRPGEPWFLAVRVSLLKYLQGSIDAFFEYSPVDDSNAYELSAKKKSGAYSYNAILGKDPYENLELTLSIKRKELFPSFHLSAVSLAIKGKKTLEEESTDHMAASLGGAIKPRLGIFDLSLNWSLEKSLPGKNKEISYKRATAILNSKWSLPWRWELANRLFGGTLRVDDSAPNSEYFRINNLSEVGLRVDSSELELQEDFYSLTNDLFTPFPVSLPGGSYVLGEKIRLNLFHDLGWNKNKDFFTSSGFGLLLPLGGDIEGAGAFSFTKLSLSTVLHYRTPEGSSQSPRFLFSIGGKN